MNSYQLKLLVIFILQCILDVSFINCDLFMTTPREVEDYSVLNVTKYDPSFQGRILSRRKRYLIFPEGSNFVVSIYRILGGIKLSKVIANSTVFI